MFTLKFNGKPFRSGDFERAIREAALKKVKEHLHEQLSSIRLPRTGEFPVVQVLGSDLGDMRIHIEGSPELLELVRERISPEDLENVTLIATSPNVQPTAFLSYAWEDRELAQQIAEHLQANGIDTWWAGWEINAGDSLRQKIDDGLKSSTVFIVLLTPTSIKKPWVNQEMDAGLVKKLQERARFMPLRKDLDVNELPPLLQGMYSPELLDFEKDTLQLISDIRNVSRKPPLGPAPTATEEAVDTGYSPRQQPSQSSSSRDPRTQHTGTP